MTESWMWLITFLPLLIFVLVDFYSGLRSGIIAAIVTALAAFFLVWWLIDEFDWEALFVVAVMAGAGWLSVRKKTPLYFKLQPAITSGVIALYLGYCQFFDVPFLVRSWPTIGKLMNVMHPEQAEFFSAAAGQKLLGTMSLYFLLWTMVHIALVTWAAVKSSNTVWIVIKGLGVPIILIGSVCTFFASAILERMMG